MSITQLSLTSCGHKLNTSDETFGELVPSDEFLGQPESLRERLERDGYLYIPGFFERDDVLAARATLTEGLLRLGFLNPDYPHTEAVWSDNPPTLRTLFPELTRNNPQFNAIPYGKKLLGFYEQFFGESVLHFDYTWLRAMIPGLGTNPHCDLVYMGRGTHDLLTCWIPYGDVSFELGGLMVLEDSHHKSHIFQNYLNTDVDTYCENRPEQVKRVKEEGGSLIPGHLSTNPASLREKLGGRWLTTEYRAGDFITFKMNLVHASLDNGTNRMRLSSDTRYQRASEPADERWIGPSPIGHKVAGKRGRIC